MLARHWRRRVLGGSPAGLIYGVLTVATVIAAENTRQETFPKVIGASLLAMALYWLAHAYAYHLGSRLERPGEWSAREFVVSVAHEAVILGGAALPEAALVGAWAAGARLEAGVTTALWCAAIEIVTIEVVASVRRHAGLRDKVVETLLGIAIGTGILVVRLILH